MSLQIKQRHQFFSGEYNIDLLKFSNNDVYLNIQQINNLFGNTFDHWLHSSNREGNHLEFKARQYFTYHGYATPKDYLNDIIQIIDDNEYCSIHCMFRYISDNNQDFSEKLYDFYISI